MTAPIINPYKVGFAVTGSDFYGRKELLSQVRQALSDSNVVLLQGQRRIGKSSFIQQLSHFLSSDTVGEVYLDPLMPVIIDIQRNVEATLAQFQKELAEKISNRVEKLYATSLKPFLSESECKSNPTVFLGVWLPQVFERLGSQEIVILVDEFDNLGEQQKANQAAKDILDFLGKLVSDEQRLKWVFTVGRQSGKLPIEYDRIVQKSPKFTISFLSLEETRQLILEPASKSLTYEPKAIERIYELTNGQPLLTQGLCHQVFEHLVIEEERDIVTVEDVNTARCDTFKAYTPAIASIVEVPTFEQRVLVAVAELIKNGKIARRTEIVDLFTQKNDVRIERNDLESALESLLEWQLLVFDNPGYRVAVELVRIWITENLSLEPSTKEQHDILKTLAKNHCEYGDKLLLDGSIPLAIKEYRTARQYIQNYDEALVGLAKAYQQDGNFAKKVEILRDYRNKKSGDFNALRLLLDALKEYAKQCEEKGNLSEAAKQYKELIGLQNNEKWSQEFVKIISKIFKLISKDIEQHPDEEKLNEILSQIDECKGTIESALEVINKSSNICFELKKVLNNLHSQQKTILIRIKLKSIETLKQSDLITREFKGIPVRKLPQPQEERQAATRLRFIFEVFCKAIPNGERSSP